MPSSRTGVLLTEVPKAGRRLRRPRHTFQIRQRPWQVQPFFIAPVLPGETMKNLLLQARIVSDPVKSPLIGWWAEHYFFYVPHRSMPNSTAWQTMMLDPAFDYTGYDTAAVNAKHYHPANAIDWVAECQEAVIAEFFRNDGEAWNVATLDAVPLCGLTEQTWMDNLVDDDTADVDPDTLPGQDPDGHAEGLPDHLSSFSAAFDQWQNMLALKLTDQTYEDFLRTYGVKAPKVVNTAPEEIKPELVRFSRDWTYPSNTIDPTTGAPTSALSWSIAERADKDRYFKEPGFLYGVQIIRPKVYMSKQTGNASAMLRDAFAWLPAVLADEVYTSVKKFVTGATPDGPLGANPTDDYWVDVRDLFIYGDQFVNFALTETNAGLVALPTAALQKRFPASADADGLFTSASPANQVRSDGVVSLNIMGTQKDHT